MARWGKTAVSSCTSEYEGKHTAFCPPRDYNESMNYLLWFVTLLSYNFWHDIASPEEEPKFPHVVHFWCLQLSCPCLVWCTSSLKISKYQYQNYWNTVNRFYRSKQWICHLCPHVCTQDVHYGRHPWWCCTVPDSQDTSQLLVLSSSLSPW